MDGSTNKSLSIANPSESNLTSTVLDQDLRILFLTAANPGAGTTTSALALASQLAQMSSGQVLLVDASQSASNLTQQLGLTKERGFRDLMFNTAEPAAVAGLCGERLQPALPRSAQRPARSRHRTPDRRKH